MAPTPVSSVAPAGGASAPAQAANWTPVLYNSNGQQMASILPGTNIPPGYTATDYNTWKGIAQKTGVNGTGQPYIAGQTVGQDFGSVSAYDKYLQDPNMGSVIKAWDQGNMATPSGQVQVKDSQGNMVWTTQDAINQDQNLQQGKQNGSQVQVGTSGNYAPAGSAAANNPLGVNSAPQQNANSDNGAITMENGSYMFNGTGYSSLQYAQQAAMKAGMSPTYTPPPSASGATGPVQPSRSQYTAGSAGDYQYQLAMQRYTDAQNGTQWKTPTNTTPAITAPNNLGQVTSLDQADTVLNSLQTAIQNEASSANSGPPGSGGSSSLTSLDSFINGIEGTPSAASNSGAVAPPGGPGTAVSPTTPSGQPPAPYNAAAALTAAQQQYGISGLQSQQADLSAQIKALQGASLTNQELEQQKTVPLGVMQGRITTEDTAMQERIAPLQAQLDSVTSQISQATTAINTLMTANQTTFDNAEKSYSDQFSQALQMATFLKGVQNDQMTQEDNAQKTAAANLAVVTNAMTSGALTWESLDPSTQQAMSKLELQAGMPPGTIQALTQKNAGTQWTTQTAIPGVDSKGNAVFTVLQTNKQTGELKTSTITSNYAPTSSANNANKAQVTADTYRKTLITKLNTSNSMMQPNILPQAAFSALKAQYPGLTDQQYLDGLGITAKQYNDNSMTAPAPTS